MRLTKAQWIRVGVAVAGLAALVGKQYLDHQGVDVEAIARSTQVSDILETLGVGAIFSQLFPRAGDTSAAKVEAKVDAKVAEKLASIPPGAP